MGGLEVIEHYSKKCIIFNRALQQYSIVFNMTRPQFFPIHCFSPKRKKKNLWQMKRFFRVKRKIQISLYLQETSLIAMESWSKDKNQMTNAFFSVMTSEEVSKCISKEFR